MSGRRFRALALDGGGVRGLSSLHILRKLLCLVSDELYGVLEPPIAPQMVFDIVVGTSTGGLIALMIVKLGMEIDECIQQYEGLSKGIFGKKSFVGKWSFGFQAPRYSSKIMRKLMVDLIEAKGRPANHKMKDRSRHPNLSCSVVCRQLADDHTRRRMREPCLLCSHDCRDTPTHLGEYEECEVADAARATSAAPTFFKHARTMGKILIDGGYGETNNPSWETWLHYRKFEEITKNDRIRWVNIGTGLLPEDGPPPERQWNDYLPRSLRDICHLVRDARRNIVDAQPVVDRMIEFASEADHLNYHRFNPTTGVHTISLDDYRAVDTKKIEQLTKQYLDQGEVEADLRALAQSLAAEIRNPSTADASARAADVSSAAELNPQREEADRYDPAVVQEGSPGPDGESTNPSRP